MAGTRWWCKSNSTYVCENDTALLVGFYSMPGLMMLEIAQRAQTGSLAVAHAHEPGRSISLFAITICPTSMD